MLQPSVVYPGDVQESTQGKRFWRVRRLRRGASACSGDSPGAVTAASTGRDARIGVPACASALPRPDKRRRAGRGAGRSRLLQTRCGFDLQSIVVVTLVAVVAMPAAVVDGDLTTDLTAGVLVGMD